MQVKCPVYPGKVSSKFTIVTSVHQILFSLFLCVSEKDHPRKGRSNIRWMHGVMVSTSAFLGFHQGKSESSSLSMGLNF